MKTFTTNIFGRLTRFVEAMLTITLLMSVAVFSQPTLVSPVDATLNVSTGPTLSWTSVIGATVYHLQVSLVSDFSTTVYDNAAIAGTSQAILPVLSNGTEFYWHVNDDFSGLYSSTQSFTTNPTPVDLGTAADFRILANTGITGGAGSSITGDIGVASAAGTITGFGLILDNSEVPTGQFSTSSSVTGRVYAFDYTAPTPTKITTASNDMGTAYTNAANRTPVPVGTFLNVGSGEIGSLDLGPGLYKWTSAVTISNDLTLTGNSTDVWIFQLASTLGMADGKQITLVGGALSSNIFWQVAGQVTLIGTCAMQGIILGQTGIAMGANGTLDGRALAQTNVTLITNTVLPVELVSFTAAANQQNAELRWSTATEVNNHGFEIQRSVISAQNSDKSWAKTGFVEGSGTTNAPKNYSFTDNNLSSGRYSYRLKQIDRDGKFDYSQSVEVNIGQAPQKFALLQNYPNPFNPTTKIQYSLENASQVSLKVYDLLGHEVAVLVNGNQEAGSYAVPFNAHSITVGLTSGVYFYRLEAGSFISTKKLVLMK